MKNHQILKIYGTDYKEMTVRLLEAADLQSRIGRKDCRIGIKPNLVSPSTADYGATTHPEVVAGIIEYLQAHGFRRIVIAEGSWVGDRTSEAIRVCGYDTLAKRYGVELHDAQKDKPYAVDCAGLELNLCSCVRDMDFLINVPVLKGHCQTKITCALKNMKGLIPNSEKRRFHAMGLHKPIAHLNTAIHQDFIVVDHICGDLDFEDGGNPVVRNCVMAACDPVLVDAYVCRLLHYAVDDVPYVRMAERLGVGSADLERAEICTCTQEAAAWQSAAGQSLKAEAAQAAAGQIPEKAKERNSSGQLIEIEGARMKGGQIRDGGAQSSVWQPDEELPRPKKVVELQDAVTEVESCSACYGYLLPALDRLREEGLLEKLDTKICIGQGFQGKTGRVGIGRCTKEFAYNVKGCPPTETQIYEFLKNYLDRNSSAMQENEKADRADFIC